MPFFLSIYYSGHKKPPCVPFFSLKLNIPRNEKGGGHTPCERTRLKFAQAGKGFPDADIKS